MVIAWSLLLAAIGVEVAASAALPRTESFRDPVWTAVVLAGYAASIWLLALVVRQVPVSIAYAVWAGLGTAGMAVVGYLFLDEQMDPLKVLALALVVGGVVLLNLSGAH
ncbi:small multidrug resistance pump [Nocardioides aromaticivorans]|uniref:QacE family quaternary ammonium compound efflux SMR transporter n=1 Tax=Nocardioides aromaticivorans TaxID=200618 RepID=A0A7Z0CNT0_9ACTN|nr:multidrug efflux SMR transporter [Nocardioides aromaticivorans]NYI45493.1 small multidrug resistance pump [Nocardioides aromaticivorans]QSR24595.1 QacE family quaternary ammonium compound efflux SMR transporter [Nocardioides aromaticivorans]